MGYALTKILLYGIEVPEEVAERIYNDPDCYDEGECIILEAPYEAGVLKSIKHEPWMAQDDDNSRYEVELLSDGTDSRIESLTFEPGFQHYFGVSLAFKGYGSDDNLSGKFHHPVTAKHPEAIDRWSKYALPILLKHMKEVPKPDLHTIGQTW